MFFYILYVFFVSPPSLTMMHFCITQCTYWTPLIETLTHSHRPIFSISFPLHPPSLSLYVSGIPALAFSNHLLNNFLSSWWRTSSSSQLSMPWQQQPWQQQPWQSQSDDHNHDNHNHDDNGNNTRVSTTSMIPMNITISIATTKSQYVLIKMYW